MKKLLILAVVAFGLWVAYKNSGDFFVKKPTTKSHFGTATLFMDAALAKNAALMKTYCTGSAVNSSDHVLSEIYSINPTFKRYQLEIGGVTGARISGQALCYGEQGDLFASVLLTLEEKGGTWSVSELGIRPYR
jgi:hypothetical protein